MTRILGISGYYHDSAAAIVEDGALVCAAQEERFTRIKHDPQFPVNAINFCLTDKGLASIDFVVFYDKPILKFERLLETHLAFAPAGFNRFRQAMPVWLKEKLFLKQRIRQELSNLSGISTKHLPPLIFTQHHQSHAGSAFFCSPFNDAAVLCIDGVGEWATTSAWQGQGNRLEGLWQINFPHSLGLLYSAFTYFCGFSVNEGEYKLMGLAPYGEPKYAGQIRQYLIDIKKDGTFRLNLEFFDYCLGNKMTSQQFCDLFSAPSRKPGAPIRQLDMDLAASIQQVTEEVMLKLATALQDESGANNLCLAGGVALNCVANGKLRQSGIFDKVWVQPAAGDAGGAVGAALCVWHEYLDNPRESDDIDRMSGCLLGPDYHEDDIRQFLDATGACYSNESDKLLYQKTTEKLAAGKVVGWFQGRMEFGPRALGARSILGDARSADMQNKINSKIKARESFRPFAPAVLEADSQMYFDTADKSPYMMFIEKILPQRQSTPDSSLKGLDRVNGIRSSLPAITHLDYTARIQTVSEEGAPRFYALLESFKAATDCSVLINTSFNIRGEPIVESPEDAYRCFMKTDMDTLVIGNFMLDKSDQPTPTTMDKTAALKAKIPVRDLKHFSRSLGLIVITLFGILFPILFGGLPIMPWIIGLTLLILGETTPAYLEKPYTYWHKLGHLLSRITSPFLLAIVYYVLVTPIGLLKRWLGKPSLKLRPDTSLLTYKETFSPNQDMRDPF